MPVGISLSAVPASSPSMAAPQGCDQMLSVSWSYQGMALMKSASWLPSVSTLSPTRRSCTRPV
jgi:hypothetical protein